MGGQPHRSLPKKSHMQRFGFRRRRSEELSSNFREDMAPISAAIVLQEREEMGRRRRRGEEASSSTF